MEAIQKKDCAAAARELWSGDVAPESDRVLT